MLSNEAHRKVCAVAAALLAVGLAAAPARAGEGLWDAVLEKMNVKAAPPGPAPDFVERTRPDSGDLGYMPTALPHKVSPQPVKSAADVEAAKAALDAAKVRQLDPGAPKAISPAAHKAPGASKVAARGGDKARPTAAAPAAAAD